MDDLTTRQQQVLTFIQDYLGEHGYPPSLREIAAHLRINGTLGVVKHLNALEQRGHIRREKGNSRGISLIHTSHSCALPIVGVVRAGLPAPAFEDIEGYYPVDRLQLNGGTFFLRVKGDSMVNAAILEGDLALIRPQATANNGDIVVALVEGEATLKRFYREDSHIRLQPANPNLDPIIVPAGREITILGKVVMIVRDIG